MEPLGVPGVTTSTVACIQLLESISRRVGPTRHRSTDLQNLQISLYGFHGAYDGFKLHLKLNEDDETRLSVLQHLKQPLAQSKIVLDEIQHRLDNSTFTGKNATGGLADRKLESCRRKLNETKKLCELALHADQQTIINAVKQHSFQISQITSEENARLLGKIGRSTELEDSDRQYHEDVQVSMQQAPGIWTPEMYRKRIIQWLSRTDPQVNHNAACAKREPGTGNWFIQREDFRRWTQEPASFLWLHGAPGCGKTVLCSRIIEQTIEISAARRGLRTSQTLFYYFSFADSKTQEPRNFLLSLILQLANGRDQLHYDLMTLFEDYGSTQPPITKLTDVFATLLREVGQTFLLIDALDECPKNRSQTEILSLLSEISHWGLPSLRLVVTSRKEPLIAEVLAPLLTFSPICIQTKEVDGDIAAHVKSQLNSHHRMSQWSPDVQQEIEHALVKGASGVFQWVSSQLESLSACLRPSQIRRILDNLPKTLDDTYARVLENIALSHRREASNALKWLCYSFRPLRIEELAEIMAVNPDREPLLDRFSSPHDVLELLGGLIVTTLRPIRSDELQYEHGRTTIIEEVRLAHFSVLEYLMSDRIMEGPAADYSVEDVESHRVILETCTAYLGQLGTVEVELPHAFEEYPLLPYASLHWTDHLQHIPESNIDPSTFVAVGQTLRDGSVIRRNWINAVSFLDGIPLAGHTATCYSAQWGLPQLTMHLLMEGSDINTDCPSCGTCLMVAARKDHQELFNFLLENGADPTAKNSKGSTALHVSAALGRDELVISLLASGVDVVVRDKKCRTPLHEAVSSGHFETVFLLLGSGAQVSIKDESGKTPLHHAASQGHDSICEVLLKSGSMVDNVDFAGQTAFHLACQYAQVAVADLLLEWDADPLLPTFKGLTSRKLLGKHIKDREYGDDVQELERRIAAKEAESRLRSSEQGPSHW